MNTLFGIDKENDAISSKRELVEYIVDKLNDTEELTDEKRGEMDQKIMAKLESGKKLSVKELDYLRKTNPIMYAHAMRVQRMAEAVEAQLKHARSKEEADRIITSAMSSVSKNDPDKKYIVAALNRVETEFHKSRYYQELPNNTEDDERSNNRIEPRLFKDIEDNEDDMDLMNWSPLQEMYDRLPSFSVGA